MMQMTLRHSYGYGGFLDGGIRLDQSPHVNANTLTPTPSPPGDLARKHFSDLPRFTDEQVGDGRQLFLEQDR